MEKKLEVKNLKISFRTTNGKVQAVRNIDFDLYKGETLAIVGESGSGKSVTNRAIIGILAGNGIVESGEIIYDGQDLLKISEEDFHKIRGDKIAMIFQDPMSSLNPIMRVGNQLTEAMLLKSGASQRNARRNFNGMLKLLNANMDQLAQSDEQKKHNEEQCKIFDQFCINSTKLESAYNEKHRKALELKLDIENTLFLISKNQPIDARKILGDIVSIVPETVHPDIVVMTDELKTMLANMSAEKQSFGLFGKATAISETSRGYLGQLVEILDKATQRQKPNYFTLGYYMMKNPTANVDDMPIDELTEMTRKFLDDDFMLAFIEEGTAAVQHSHETSIKAKSACLPVIDSAMEFFCQPTLDRAQTYAVVRDLIARVDGAINRLKVGKNSTEYVFGSSIKDFVHKYFVGVKKNPKEQARFDKQMAKHQQLSARGKTPDWQVVPAALVDLELTKQNIRDLLARLKNSYKQDIASFDSFDSKNEMINLIEFLKEQASAVVYKVTKKMAKAKALKLLEEVGIPEPAIRYNQYPFEFSGGMRQRIVIAIALAANPDILICDEPTTALDVTIQSQILELINRIKEERNLSVIFITHDLGVVANMADRIAVMYAGKIVEYGSAYDIFYDPRHPYTWALLSSMPDLDTSEKLESIVGTPPNMIYPPKGDAFAERNKYALEIDFEEQPPLFQVSEGHYAATWLLHPDAPHVDPPKIVTDRIQRMKKRGGINND